ncbi:MAG: putative lipid II flippase FtsW [Gemmatimonadetes bacterium]|nr:putative lipid II flippase FtsW [Gemmatimonadota bacterium]
MMAVRLMDISPSGPLTLPDTGLGRGWEAPVVMTTTLLLLAFGLVTLYSGSAFLAQRQGLPDWYFVLRQLAGAAGGLLLMMGCARVPTWLWERLAWPLVVVTFGLLVATVLPGTGSIAPEINGARRWLVVGVTMQPSEFAKAAVIVWTAAMAVKKQDQLASLTRGLLPFILVWSALLAPVLLQPNLSTACLIAALGALTVFAAGGRVAHFVFLGLLASPVLWTQLRVGFRADRLAAFLNPAVDPAGAGFQVRQSLIAIGSGGVAGVGFGQGRQKYGFLPEPHNDFIFAMVGEEWGLLGVVLVVGLYATLVLVGYRIARRATAPYSQLLALGATNLVALQALLHMAVGLALVPPTGLALPLFSYGRSNLLVTLACLGMLMAVARETEAGTTRPGRGRA